MGKWTDRLDDQAGTSLCLTPIKSVLAFSSWRIADLADRQD